MNLQILLIIAFGGALATYALAKISSVLRNLCAVLASGLLVVLIGGMYGSDAAGAWLPSFLGLPLVLQMNSLSWLFAITISIIGFLSIIFSISYIKGKESTDFYFLMMLIVTAGMLGVVLSGDLISFYIFWEIMSWSTFLLISYNKGAALAAAMKYIIMSIAGSVLMLMGMLTIYTSCGSVVLTEIAGSAAGMSTGEAILLLIVFSVAFGIKNAAFPLHTWLPGAHAEAPAPFSAVLSGVLIKVGTYGFILFIYVIGGGKFIFSLGAGGINVRFILCVLAAVTILVPSFIAVLQDDAKRLLAWSSIAQAGYILLGIMFGTTLGFTGGVLHFVNHALFKALLFFAVGAVEYRTGTRDLNSLGGLIKKMPMTFAVLLVGVCGLIGVPVTNGFVSKWLIYKTLILEQSPFLAFVALLGTWGTILYSYKLIHNIFFGQLPQEHRNIKEVPVTMRVPMIALSVAVVLFGVMPGIPLKAVNAVAHFAGAGALDVNLWGVVSETGTVNLMNILAGILAVGIIVWIVFKAGAGSVPVSQEDNYAAGAAVPAGKYTYTVDFYSSLTRIIRPFLRDVMDEFYFWCAGRIKALCAGARRIYTGDVGNYVVYIVIFAALLVILQIWRSPW